MKIRFAFIMAIVGCSSMLALGQEKTEAENQLVWLPDGKYSAIAHENIDLMRAAESYEDYRKYVDTEAYMKGIGRRLPATLESSLSFWTSARLEEITIHKYQGRGRPDPPADLGVTFYTNAGGYNYVLYGIGKTMFICRFADDLETLIKQAMKKGEIEKTGDNLDGRSVYAYKTRYYDGESRTYYAYVTLDGLLLVAPNLTLLSSMVETGSGRELGMLDNPDYEEFLGFVPSLGPAWSLKAYHPFLKAMLKRLEEENAESFDIERHMNIMENVQKFTIRTFTLGDSVVYKAIDVYIDENKAREIQETYASHQYVNQFPKEFDRLFQLNSEYTYEGNILFSTFEYTPEMLEAKKKACGATLSELEKELSGLKENNGDPKRIEYLESRIQLYKEESEHN